MTPDEIAKDFFTAAPSHRTAERLVELVRDAQIEGFKAGFEHAVAGGEEAMGIIPKGNLPLVMYFVTVEDRREMIDAVQLAKPGMATMKIPERRRTT